MNKDIGLPLPDGIGPHEGYEFDLMKRGRKNVALFMEIKPDGLDLMLGDGFNILKFKLFENSQVAYFAWLIFRDGFETDALRLKQLICMPGQGFDPAREREIGAILSYTPDQIQAYIDHWIYRHGATLAKKNEAGT